MESYYSFIQYQKVGRIVISYESERHYSPTPFWVFIRLKINKIRKQVSNIWSKINWMRGLRKYFTYSVGSIMLPFSKCIYIFFFLFRHFSSLVFITVLYSLIFEYLETADCCHYHTLVVVPWNKSAKERLNYITNINYQYTFLILNSEKSQYSPSKVFFWINGSLKFYIS